MAYTCAGELGRCLVWEGELVDAQMIDALSEALYLCMPVAATSTGSNAVKIALPVLVAALLLSCIFFIWFCRFRGTIIFASLLFLASKHVILDHSYTKCSQHKFHRQGNQFHREPK